MFMQNPQRTGTADNVNPVNNQTLWKFDVDNTGMIISVTSTAAVVGGIVYVGSQNGFLYALDASTGKLFWRFNTGESLLASPVVADGVVYIGNIRGVFALDAYKGTQIWKTQSIGNQRIDASVSTPAVSGGMLYVGTFADNRLYAFRVSDGQLMWQFQAGDYVDSSPVVVGDTVYVGSNDYYLYAINAQTGALKWKYNCSQPFDSVSSPVVVNNIVYVTSYDGNVFALNAETGQKIWNHTTSRLSSIFAAPAFSNGVIYQTANKTLYALDATTGNELWNFTSAVQIQSCPAIADGVVYIGGNDGILYALEASSGEQVWQYTIGYPIVASASVANGVIYIGARNGTLYAIGSIYSPDVLPPPTNPTPTPTPTPTPSPTASPSTSQSTPVPTLTSATPQPTPTHTPKPTETALDQLTDPTTQQPTTDPKQVTAPLPTTLLIVGGISGILVIVGSVGLVRYSRRKL